MEEWHGTTNGYANKKCRCEDCKKAWRKYCKERRLARTPEDEFPHGTSNGYTNYRCRCAACTAANQDQYRSYTYGMELGSYKSLYDAQGGKCFLCGAWQKILHVDHDHKSGYVRGLLCIGCNSSIGKLGDNIEGLQRAMDYLTNPPLANLEIKLPEK